MSNYRLYSFVAGGYLSELQKGLQTAHGVGELLADSLIANNPSCYDPLREWASKDKTIIILDAFNHAGVLRAYEKLVPLARKLGLPMAKFHEDEQSMNGMATCAVVIVPEHLYNAQVSHVMSGFGISAVVPNTPSEVEFMYKKMSDIDPTSVVEQHTYKVGSPEYEFISILKSYKLA